jgi:hypothetical protein
VNSLQTQILGRATLKQTFIAASFTQRSSCVTPLPTDMLHNFKLDVRQTHFGSTEGLASVCA